MKIDTYIEKHIVFIIESLPQGDLKTGRNLYDGLRQLWISVEDYDVLYKEIESKRDMVQLLHDLSERVKSNDNHNLYILQFETHGREVGMQLASGEFIRWGELFSMIRPININMYDTLLVVLSMCDSKSIAYNIEPTERSPFRGVVVTDDNISCGYLDSIWIDFYKKLRSHFSESHSSRYFSDFTPEHIWFLNQEFIFDIHSDLEENNPALFENLKDSFAHEFEELLRNHPNEIFLMSRENYLKWRIDNWRRNKKRLRDYFCFRDIIGKYQNKEAPNS